MGCGCLSYAFGSSGMAMTCARAGDPGKNLVRVASVNIFCLANCVEKPWLAVYSDGLQNKLRAVSCAGISEN